MAGEPLNSPILDCLDSGGEIYIHHAGYDAVKDVDFEEMDDYYDEDKAEEECLRPEGQGIFCQGFFPCVFWDEEKKTKDKKKDVDEPKCDKPGFYGFTILRYGLLVGLYRLVRFVSVRFSSIRYGVLLVS